MATETDSSVVKKLKLKLKLAINRFRSIDGDMGVRKRRILSGRNGVGREEERRSGYMSGRNRKESVTDDVGGFEERFRSNGRCDGKRGSRMREEVETLNGKFGSVGVRRKSEFPRVRKTGDVEKSLRTIWVPSKNDKVIREDKQIRRNDKGQRADVSDSQWKLKKFNRKGDGALGDRENGILNEDLSKSRRRTNLSGKIVEDGRSGETGTSDEQVRKRKRIRIHRLDVSNKRLDDAVLSAESTELKSKEDDEKDKTISFNAQFRAIKPTPSILSFVEDNVISSA